MTEAQFDALLAKLDAILAALQALDRQVRGGRM
jgi:hypothetical protein